MSGPWEEFSETVPAAGEAAAGPAPWEEFAPAEAQAPAATPKKRRRNLYGEVAGAMANFNRGLGIGDEFVASARTVGGLLSGDMEGGLLGSFRSNMAEQRQLEDEYAADRPMAAGLLKGTGMAGTALVPAGGSAGLLASSPRWLNIGRGALSGAVSAAGYSAVDRGTVEERIGAASDSATNPLVLALGGASGALAPSAAGAGKSRAPAPSLEELQLAKNAAYQAVDNAGVRYAPTAMDGLVAGITDDVASKNLSATRHPKAASMLQDIQAMKGQSPSLTELDQLRQVIRRDVASATDPAEAFFGQRMIRKLDEFIDGAGPAQVIAGDAEDAAGMIRNARDLNTRVRKIEAVTEGVERAKLRAGSTGSGGNVDNATRQEMRRILEKTPNLTDDEAVMLERIVVGSKTQNALRQVGKLSPQGNGLMQAMHMGALLPSGGLSAVVAGAGAGSKVAADAMTQRNVQALVEEIARGGSPAAKQALQVAAEADPALARVLQEVSARLSRAGGVAAAREPAVSVEVVGKPELGRGVSYGRGASTR